MIRPIVRLIAVIALALLVGACKSDEEKLLEHRARGDAYFEEGAFNEAIIEYKNVLQIDPNDGEVHYQLAKAYFEIDRLRDGFWELRETVRLLPDHIDAKIQLAQTLFYAREFEESMEQIDAAIAAEPDRVEAYVVRAQTLAAMGRADESLESFAKAVEVGPEEEGALLLYAHALERSGQPEQAEEWFRKLTAQADNFRAHASLATFLARLREEERRDEAIASFERAIEVAEPEERPAAYNALASYYYSLERFDDAIATLEAGIAASEEKLDLIYALARFHTAQGNQEAADELIERATKERPDEARPFMILSAYRDRQGDLEGALEAAKQAVAAEPDNQDALLREAEVVIEIGVQARDDAKVDEGRKLVEALLEQKPDHAGALLVRSKVDLYEQRIPEAISALRTTIELRPEWAQAHFVLGTALAMQDDQAGARSALARALELDASLSQARRVLVQVHSSLREDEFAVEEGRRYLRERPDDVALRILVAQSMVRLGRSAEADAELSAISEADRNAEVDYAQGRIALGKRDFPAARAYLLRALEEKPANYDILNSLYLLDRVEDRVAESEARVAAAIAEYPDRARLYVLKGNLELARGAGAAAEASYKRAIELDGSDLTAYQELARYFAVTGRVQEAISTYQTAATLRPNNPQIHHLLGVLHELAGQREQAIAAYEKAIEHGPNMGEAKNNLAYLFADQGQNLDRALDLAQEAKELLPNSANAADTLGWVLFKRGVPAAAISYLQEAEAGTEADSPSLGVVRYHLALAYEQNGDTELAQAAAERALEHLESMMQATRERGGQPQEPDWAADARSLLDRVGRG